MHEILSRLPAGKRVLDLGCARGSFPDHACAATVIRCDLDQTAGRGVPNFVCADAQSLPFAAASFDAVILNHSLEHLPAPEAVLAGIRRIARPACWLYVAVPDASTLTDRLYRWLGRGGGHVNRFTDPGALVRLVEEHAGLPHIATRALFTSLSFLNEKNLGQHKQLKVRLFFAGGAEWLVRVLTLGLRKLDRWFGTRTSAYGWAFCFGPALDFDLAAWSNVCIRCGAGHPSEQLTACGKISRTALGFRCYHCPSCGAKNYFTEDRDSPR